MRAHLPVLFTTKTGIEVHMLAQGPAKRW